MNIKPILKDNTWEEIIWASENNCIPDTWKVGDEIDLALFGKYNEMVTLQIWDFNHFDKSDGSGKANILFGMKHLMKDREYMNHSFFNTGGWNNSYMRTAVMNNVFNSMPAELRNGIKEVDTYASLGSTTPLGKGLLSKDKVFIPGLTECCNTFASQNQTETGQTLISIFKYKKNRIKRMNNGSGSANWWWTRSPYYSYYTSFCSFGADGDWYNFNASYSDGVCFCFNI